MDSNEADRQIAEGKKNSQKYAEPSKEDKRVTARDGNVLNVRFGK